MNSYSLLMNISDEVLDQERKKSRSLIIIIYLFQPNGLEIHHYLKQHKYLKPTLYTIK